MPTADTTDRFACLLRSYWAGSASAHQVFSHANRQALLRRVRSVMAVMATDLSPDLAEDVVQYVWLALTSRKTFDEERGRPGAYIHCLILTGIRSVRAENARPGHTTRLQKAVPGAGVPLPRLVSLDDVDRATGRSLGDTIAAPHNPILQADDTIATQQTLAFARATAPPTTALALELVYREGISLAQAAVRVGVHRTTLQRNLKTWASQHGAALAA